MGLHPTAVATASAHGRPRANDRQTIDAILYVLITAAAGRICRASMERPRRHGVRLKRWSEEGIWERTWRAALAALDAQSRLDWSMAFLDGSFAPAKRGGSKVGLTRKGKGTKWMLVTDGNGLPLGFHLDSAQVAEVRLAERTLDTIKGRSSPAADPNHDLANWWRIVDTIAARFARPCGVGGCACASRPNGVQRRGRPSVDVQSWRARKTIGSGTR